MTTIINSRDKLNEQLQPGSTACKSTKGAAVRAADKTKSVVEQPTTRPIDTSLIEPLSLGSDQALRRRFMVVDEPIAGNFRFGLLLEILDKLAEETALDYVNFLCVEAGIERISRVRSSKAQSNSCFFTFVNVDREMVRRPVPPLYPNNYAEDARYLNT